MSNTLSLKVQEKTSTKSMPVDKDLRLELLKLVYRHDRDEGVLIERVKKLEGLLLERES